MSIFNGVPKESTDIEVVPTRKIGEGTFKIAYSVKQSTSPPKEHNYKIPSTSDPANFVFVRYEKEFAIEEYKKTKDPDFVTFKTKIDSNPELKFYIMHILSYDKTDSEFISYKEELIKHGFKDIFEKGEKYVETFKELKKLGDLRDIYINNEDLFDCVNELTELFDLGGGGSTAAGGGSTAAGGGSKAAGGGTKLSPQLFGVSVNTHSTSNEEKPFSMPSDIYSEIDKIIASLDELNESSIHTFFEITYLIEKCGIPIVNQHKSATDKPKFLIDMGHAINAFVEKFVNTKNKLHGDLKIENLCPDYSKTPIEVNLLDVDPNYSILNYDGDPNFSKHAKVFMKFLVFAHASKHPVKDNRILFPEWFITQTEVDDMIVFFYQKKYLKFVFNPINMLFYHLNIRQDINKYSELIKDYSQKDEKQMDKLKSKFKIPQTDSALFPGGGKKTKKRKSRKRKTNKKRT